MSNFNCAWIEDQLLLYIGIKSGVRKSKIIHAIKLKYTLLFQGSNLIIIASMSAIMDNICDSTIYVSLVIGIRKRHGKSNAISNLQIAWYIMIVDKISIVKLEILFKIGK